MGQKSEHQQEEGCCPGSESIPGGPAPLSGIPEGSWAIPPTHKALNRVSIRLMPLPVQSSPGGFTAAWKLPGI